MAPSRGPRHVALRLLQALCCGPCSRWRPGLTTSRASSWLAGSKKEVQRCGQLDGVDEPLATGTGGLQSRAKRSSCRAVSTESMLGLKADIVFQNAIISAMEKGPL